MVKIIVFKPRQIRGKIIKVKDGNEFEIDEQVTKLYGINGWLHWHKCE